MAANCFIVRDHEGRELAGPFNEGAARLWVAFNYYHYPALAIACVDPVWEPLAAYDNSAQIPANIWDLQKEGKVVVVVVPGGHAKVFA